MKARLLRSLIAERVAPGTAAPGPRADWTVGRCRHCDERVWLSRSWVEVLARDPQAVASCFECAHALVEDPH
ncbi:MAG: hypothetical protein AB1679_05660 [Actinomycetota bacterium]